MTAFRLPPRAEAPATAVVRFQGQYHLVAMERVEPGQRILRLEGELRAEPSATSIQLDLGQHLEVPREDDLELILDHYRWRCLHHSCDPSTLLRGRDLVARRKILPWQELTFDFESTELDLLEPFACVCGSARCRGRIQGYRHLGPAERRRLWPRLTDYLRRLEEAGDVRLAGASA